jgi:transposase
MRKQMNGLAALVEGVLKADPFSGALFVFINRRRDKLKMLVWDRTGFIGVQIKCGRADARRTTRTVIC